jgi:hypothetical protein
MIGTYYAPDDELFIETRLRELINAGADLLITTGGMSVDPDDVTRFAIRNLGAEDMTYGSAVLPGAMFLVGSAGLVHAQTTESPTPGDQAPAQTTTPAQTPTTDRDRADDRDFDWGWLLIDWARRAIREKSRRCATRRAANVRNEPL